MKCEGVNAGHREWLPNVVIPGHAAGVNPESSYNLSSNWIPGPRTQPSLRWLRKLASCSRPGMTRGSYCSSTNLPLAYSKRLSFVK